MGVRRRQSPAPALPVNEDGGPAVRVAAGFVLSAGVVSLIVSLETQTGGPGEDSRFTGAPVIGAIWQPGSGVATDVVEMDGRRHSMAAQKPPGATLGRSWESASSGSDVTAGADTVRPASSGEPQAGSTPGGQWLIVERVEDWIRQYPWPTVLAGIGLGFLLARRARR